MLLLLAIAVPIVAERNRYRRLAILNESETYDLQYLWECRAVTPVATGQTITRIEAEIQNETDKALHVLVNVGTYFVASGNHQNMVTTFRHTFLLAQRAKQRVLLDAACINAGRPIPGEKDRFIGVAQVSDNVRRFLEETRRMHVMSVNAMMIQAGVWAITDNLSGDQIKNRLVARTSTGYSRTAISDSDIGRAKLILDRLGIPNWL